MQTNMIQSCERTLSRNTQFLSGFTKSKSHPYLAFSTECYLMKFLQDKYDNFFLMHVSNVYYGLKTVLNMTSPFKNLPYNMVSASVCVRIVQKSNGERCALHASLMYTFSRAYGLPKYNMVTFLATKGLLNPVNSLISSQIRHTLNRIQRNWDQGLEFNGCTVREHQAHSNSHDK